jgi:hypothetical protein
MDNPERTINAEFEYTANDAVLGVLWSFFLNRGVRVMYGILMVLGLITAASAVQGSAASAVQGSISGRRSILYLLALYIVLPAIVGLTGFLNHRKMSSDRRLNRYAFSSKDVRIENGVGQALISWQAFQDAVETRRAFYLSPQASLWHIIPKRGFSSESDVDGTRKLIADALGDKARLRSQPTPTP